MNYRKTAINNLAANAVINLLKRSGVWKKLGVDKSNEEIKEMPFEEILEVINAQNN